MLGSSASFTPTCFLLISYLPNGDSFIRQTYNASTGRFFGQQREIVLYARGLFITVTLLHGYPLEIPQRRQLFGGYVQRN